MLDTIGRHFDQSRRFRLALLREGRIDFAERSRRRVALKNAIVARDEATALAMLEDDIRAEMT
jgi:hypothetical protein